LENQRPLGHSSGGFSFWELSLCAHARVGQAQLFFNFGAAHFAKQKIIIVFCFCKIRNPAAAKGAAALLAAIQF